MVWGWHVGMALAVTNVLEKAEYPKHHMETDMDTLWPQLFPFCSP